MKTNLAAALVVSLLAAAALAAAPLTETTAVHTRPDLSAPTITFLKAGTAPTFAPAQAPSGWVAVELSGPFEGYVPNKDIGKNLDVRPGTSVHLHPQNESAIITTVEPGDQSAITGLHGRWTQISLEKKIVGYIRVATSLAPAPTPAPAPAPAATAGVLTDVAPPAPAPAEVAPPAPAPVTPTAYGVGTAGQSAPVVNLGSSSGALPRLFQGKFVSSRRPFSPRRPYDWQLNDNAGVRYAYLDLSKLLLTEQIEKYADHVVVVFGKPKPMPGGRDIVIEVESLQLK